VVVPEAIVYASYQPQFVDIDRNLNMSAEEVRQSLLRGEIKVVLATHQFGLPCQIKEIAELCSRHSVLLVEDAAAALGASVEGQMVGTFGDAAIISFHRTKVISGDVGGALLVRDVDLARKVAGWLDSVNLNRSSSVVAFLRALGWWVATRPESYGFTHKVHGHVRGEAMFEHVVPIQELPAHFVASCAPFSAALADRQLDGLRWNLARRRTVASVYATELSGRAGLTLPQVPAGYSPAWIQFPVMVEDRESLYCYMQRRGVDLSWTFRYSCADSFHAGQFPNTERAAHKVLGLPTYPVLSEQDAQDIACLVQRYPG
jgi:dTDP-4-amino-4,6-dideoxygalactose transaminase